MAEKTVKNGQLQNDYHKGMDPESIIQSFQNHIKYTMGKDKYTATDWDRFYSISRVVMDRLIERWIATQQTYYNKDAKRVYYLSLEFLIGRLLGNNIMNLMMFDETKEALDKMGLDIQDIRDVEVDAGLGNGGLGRLAACFLDSMATLELPAYGYGIRYEFGIFKQLIKDGHQIEIPDEWLKFGNPWEIARPESAFEVKFGGHVENRPDKKNEINPTWVNYQTVLGIPYDTPIPGYNNNTVNTLRLWGAKASEEFDLEIFNYGDYIAAVENKNLSEGISKVLYPNDNIYEGKELRFKQEFFFVSCTIQDILRRFKKTHGTDFAKLPDKVAIQLNDTHPALGIPELMHILVDEEKLSWDKAWAITTKTFAFTNHTLLPEALEKWPLDLFNKILPRHLQIVYEINRRFMRDVSSKFFNDHDKIVRLSLIEEGDEKQVRMANISVVGSHSVNGVAALHTELLKANVLNDFYDYSPEKFNNKTNGITPRRWLLKANPSLAKLITKTIGSKWTTDLTDLKKLEKFATDKKFVEEFQAVKMENKKVLSGMILNETGYTVNPKAIFYVQIKRIHEYKRQLLTILSVVMKYLKIKENPKKKFYPQVFIFGGKSAPGYKTAKLIIKLINSVADVINNDTAIKGKLKVIFYPNYRVSVAEKLFPGSDVSVQVSTAGKEASGTGNMKFTLNGALTIGTLDGANVEIREEVGEDNFYLFGRNVDELKKITAKGYDPKKIYENDPLLKEALDLINSDFFESGKPELFKPLFDALVNWGDEYFLLEDIHDYLEKQDLIEKDFQDQANWTRMAIINVANTGKFSSDRTIAEYAKDIWNVKAVPIKLDKQDCI